MLCRGFAFEVPFSTTAFCPHLPSDVMLFSTIFTTSSLLVTASKLYSAFASPIVSNGDIADGKWPNQTHSLAKRVDTPVDVKCNQGDVWVTRRCYPTVSLRFWADFCLGRDAQNHPDFYVVGGSCPPQTMCANLDIPSHNGVDLRPTQTILCIPIALHLTDIIRGVGGNINQIGVVNVVGPGAEAQNQGRTVSIVVQNAIPRASVSALLQGTYPCPSFIFTW
jgi:hypothetical protein